jgi:hypothetical protein
MPEVLPPDSFRLQADLARHGGPELIWFSFVTLTTPGFGDAAPFTARARSLSILQTLTGRMQLAVMIAWFVNRCKPGKSPPPSDGQRWFIPSRAERLLHFRRRKGAYESHVRAT